MIKHTFSRLNLFATLLLIAFLTLFSLSPAFAESYTQTFTKNGNTYIITKTIEDETVTITTKIYNPDGELIDTRVKTKETTSKTKDKSSYPTKTKEAPESYKTITPSATAAPSPTPNEISNGGGVSISSFMETELPLDLDSETGTISVKTQNGTKELKSTPQEIHDKATKGGLDLIGKFRLVSEDGDLVYRVEGSKVERLFAIFEVYLPTTYKYDVETGELVEKEQSNLIKITDFLSF